MMGHQTQSTAGVSFNAGPLCCASALRQSTEARTRPIASGTAVQNGLIRQCWGAPSPTSALTRTGHLWSTSPRELHQCLPGGYPNRSDMCLSIRRTTVISCSANGVHLRIGMITLVALLCHSGFRHPGWLIELGRDFSTGEMRRFDIGRTWDNSRSNSWCS
jgi:hypothetical protein